MKNALLSKLHTIKFGLNFQTYVEKLSQNYDKRTQNVYLVNQKSGLACLKILTEYKVKYIFRLNFLIKFEFDVSNVFISINSDSITQNS